MLFRHGKSSWDDDSIPDRERPLTNSGKRAAKAAGAWIEEQGIVPDQVFVSPALRARTTLDLAKEAWTKPTLVKPAMEALFTKGGTNYFDLIRENGGKVERLMFVGHNPAMEVTCQTLVGTGDAALRKLVKQTFPTAGVAVIEFQIDSWTNLQKNDGNVVGFFTPKE